MTDKVQKIREEVEKIARSINPYIPDDEGKNSEYEAGRLAMATQILQYIDSMQEEPKAQKVLKSMLNTKTTAESLGISQEEYDKVVDECIFGEEESVSKVWHDASEKSNEPEGVVIINPSDNTGDVLTRCTGVYQGRIWAYTSELLKLSNLERIGKNWKEPVSEDLEEAASLYVTNPDNWVEWIGNHGEIDDISYIIKAFKAGAQWQK